MHPSDERYISVYKKSLSKDIKYEFVPFRCNSYKNNNMSDTKKMREKGAWVIPVLVKGYLINGDHSDKVVQG